MVEWSKYQTDIFNETADGKQHVVVNAVAGSGKSSTLIESLKYIPPNQSWLLVAFNKQIADELKSRAPTSGSVYTLHSLGLKTIASSFPKISVYQDKLSDIIEQLIGKNKDNDYEKLLDKSVRLAKATLAKSNTDIDDMLDDYNIDLLEYNREEFIANTQACLDLSKAKHSILDFDDMIYFPNVFKLKFKKYDFILIDECQDLNNAQIQFVLQMCKKKTRIFAYLDPYQSIYGFRGANFNQVYASIKSLQPKLLPLSVSYRCPTSVIKLAQKYVPEIEAAPGAKEGEVKYIKSNELFKIAKPGCFIISRTNAPMLKMSLSFIKAGVPAVIRGKDIGANLLYFIKNSKKKSIPALLDYIEKWKAKEISRLVKKKKDISAVIDKYECLMALIEDCKDIEQAKLNLNKIFADDGDSNRILFSSVHRIKGDENKTVFLLWDTFFGDDQEANNLRYVAITRAMDKLYFVTSTKKDDLEEKK